jgi:hypothetical protein
MSPKLARASVDQNRQARIPAYAYINPEQEAYLKELAQELGMSTSGVLRGLIEGAILEAREEGA